MRAGKFWASGLVVVMIASLFVAVGNARAEQSGADGFGYRWTNSDSPDPTVTFDWIEITGSGIQLSLSGDDQTAGPYPIGFDFEYYGSTRSEFYVSTNGVLGFNEDYLYSWMNAPIPFEAAPNDILAPYWDDLCVRYEGFNDGAVYYETLGSAPNRQLVVEWWQISELGTYELLTFEAILNETGEVWFQYLVLSGMNGWDATVGVENADGSDGVQYSYLTPALHDNLAIQFSLAPLGFGPDQSGYGPEGGTVPYELMVSNNQAITDSFDLTYTSVLGWSVGLYDDMMNPLGDTNGNGIPDTGDVAPGAMLNMIVTVDVPVSPSGTETTILTATSYADPAVSDDAILVTDLAPAMFEPPHSDDGLDTDGDGLYDALVLNASINVTVGDWYFVYSDLYDGSMSFIVSATNTVFLDPGIWLVGLWFDGRQIGEHGVDGPYIAEMALYSTGNVSDGLLDEDTHTTAAYAADQFEIASARFEPPYNDTGYDSDGNGLYDYLVLNVTVNVTTASNFYITCNLFDNNLSYITWWSTVMYLDLGFHLVPILFDGRVIYGHGVSGVFWYYLQIIDIDIGYFCDDDENHTGTYSIDQFELPEARYQPPYVESVEDSDGDGLYNFLYLNVTANCTEAGTYYMAADLYTPSMARITYWANDVYLTVGLNVVEIWWDGREIFNYGEDGPYDYYMIIDEWAGGLRLDEEWGVTSAYTYDQFQAPPAYFAPPHSDYGADVDGDGLYDYLVVNASIHVVTSGDFAVYAEVHDMFGNYITANLATSSLEMGNRSIEVSFNGFLFHLRGTIEPYYVLLWLYDEYWDFLDMNYYATGVYDSNDFTDVPGRIFSVYTDSPPTIDGSYSPGEWADAVSVSLTEADPYNMLDALLLVKNNETHLFVCYDVIGDTTSSIFDMSSIAFDTGNDEVATDGREDQFMVGPFVENGQAHYVYESSWSDWTDHCSPFNDGLPGHAGLEGAFGFGRSDASSVNHRIYEYAIPLALLGAEPGDVLSFAGLSSVGPGVGDSDTWNWSSWPLSVMIVSLDLFGDLWLAFSPPMTTATLDGTLGLDDWYVSPVTVTLEATGGNKGINRTVCRVDSGDWQNYSEPIVVSGEGSHLVEFYSIDNRSNEEEMRNVTFKIDALDPVSVATVTGTAGSNGWYVSDVDVSLAADDGLGSGVAVTKFRIDGGAWQDYSESVTFTSAGTHTVAYYSVDVAGNSEASKSITVMIDKAAPSSSHALFGTLGPDDWYSTEVTIVLSAIDASPGSGVDAIRYSLDGNTWTAYDSPIVVIESGTHTLEYRAVDAAGNQETTRSVTFKLDVTAPKTTHELSGTLGSHGWYTSAVEVTLAVTDNVDGSGPDVTMYRIGSGLWQTYSTPISLAEDGEVTFSFYSVDLVGNEETATDITMKIDRAAPLTVASVSETTVTLSASDGTSGLAKTMYRIDGGAWQNYTAALTVTGKGNHTIEYYSIDSAGNSETVKTTWVEIGGGGVLGGGAALALAIAAIVIVVAVALYFLLWRKKKSTGEGPAEPPA